MAGHAAQGDDEGIEHIPGEGNPAFIQQDIEVREIVE